MKSSKSLLNIDRPGVAARALISGLAGAMLALTGCAADLDTGDAPAEREMVEYSPDIIAQIKTDSGVQLTFTAEYESGDGSGDPVVAITELVPASAPSYLDYLREQQATSLESFLALSPEGTEAPARLRAAHEREAIELGRSAEVREVSLASVTMSATYDSATCDSYAAFTNSVSSWIAELTGSSTNHHSLIFQNGGNVTAAMCNYDSNRVDYKYAQFCYEVTVQGSDLGLLYCDARITVPDGHRVNKTWLNATTDRLVRAEKLPDYALTVTSYIAIGGVPAIP
jgi:hypothetical protein